MATKLATDIALVTYWTGLRVKVIGQRSRSPGPDFQDFSFNRPDAKPWHKVCNDVTECRHWGGGPKKTEVHNVRGA